MFWSQELLYRFLRLLITNFPIDVLNTRWLPLVQAEEGTPEGNQVAAIAVTITYDPEKSIQPQMNANV